MDPLPTILLVDDEEMVRHVIARLLVRAFPGWRVATAADGEKGLELFRELRPSVLITDMKMGVMTGTELIAAVRREDTKTPIIVLTGAPHTAQIAGADDVMLKMNFDQLIERIKTFIGVPAAPSTSRQ